ncbi:hypothetical protein FB451DRAFT_770982 [Mycena latifolia]|nr:hypothetical protein FB451DRAFT_770982 [Mycena latifolia]
MILKQRILFKGINDLLNDQNMKIPTQYIRLWNESYASEMCLSSLNNFLKTAEAETPAAAPFIKSLAQVLHLRLESHATEVSARLKPYLTDTWEWLAMFAALQLGFLMTLVGYVGCFTIVQNSPTPSDTYIWLGVEVALALIRLATWAINPSCDDPDGVWFRLRAHNDAFLQDTLGTEENPAEMFKIVPERKFWEALTAHSGPVNIDNMKKIRGFQHWYSWIRRQTVQGSADILCIVLEGEPAVLCTMDVSHGQDVEFHSAEITSNDYTGHAVQRERLVEDHELMTAPSDFKTNVFEHYNFIFATMGGDSLPIQASWPLSESSVAGPLAIAFPIPGGGGQPGDPEQGTPGDSDTAWRNCLPQNHFGSLSIP